MRIELHAFVVGVYYIERSITSQQASPNWAECSTAAEYGLYLPVSRSFALGKFFIVQKSLGASRSASGAEANLI